MNRKFRLSKVFASLPLMVGSASGCSSDDLGPSLGDGVMASETAGSETSDMVGVAEGDDGGACVRDGIEEECVELVAPTLEMSLSQVKQFDFSWVPVSGAEYYQLLESPNEGMPYMQVGANLVEATTSLTVPVHLRVNASYKLRACSEAEGCIESAAVDVVGPLAEAIGYFKASNTDANDYFGHSVALSGDGSTLAVGAYGEDSPALGVNGDQGNDPQYHDFGAVYVFERDGQGGWSQQAYLKGTYNKGNQFGYSVSLSEDGGMLAVGAIRDVTHQVNGSLYSGGAVHVFERGPSGWSQQGYVVASNREHFDYFGGSVALSADGATLAVGAPNEDSNATGIGGNQADNSMLSAGAVYVFSLGQSGWVQEAYVKASNTQAGDNFGWSVALNGNGTALIVGAYGEDSNAAGVGGNQGSNATADSGAVYAFVFDGQWSQQAYIKASNPGLSDRFGWSVALSEDGATLAVGAYLEKSNATGVGGNQANDALSGAGAVYVFDGLAGWSQEAYIKASNTGSNDWFGRSVALSRDGTTLAVGAHGEDTNSTGIGGNQIDSNGNVAQGSGAVYVFERQNGWSQRAYVKASNTGGADEFGHAVALSDDGSTLAVGAWYEDSVATGIGGNQADESASKAGAVYVY